MAGSNLHYVDHGGPGISRRRSGRGWAYFGPDGKRVTSRDEIDRLNAIGMPPAYRKVWFCPDPNGHIQAVGYDARGRRQYRYHPEFRAARDGRKFDRMAAFGRCLARLRKRVEADLGGDPTSREAVAAAVVRLIDETCMRVGNEEYARANKSFGATTLRNRHVEVNGHRLEIAFPGKSGITCKVKLTDRRLARVAKRTQELPGQHLFEYVDGEGSVRTIGSGDINDYLRDTMGGDFTAKDFRTWSASVIAFATLVERMRDHGRVSLKTMIEPVADALGNTPAISRKSYVHPALIKAAQDKGPGKEVELPRATKYLDAAERGLIVFLEAQRRKAPRGGSAGAR